MDNATKALLSAASKVKTALNEAEGLEVVEVFSLGGGTLETLTDAELAMLMRSLVNEQSRRQGLM